MSARVMSSKANFAIAIDGHRGSQPGHPLRLDVDAYSDSQLALTLSRLTDGGREVDDDVAQWLAQSYEEGTVDVPPPADGSPMAAWFHQRLGETRALDIAEAMAADAPMPVLALWAAPRLGDGTGAQPDPMGPEGALLARVLCGVAVK